MSLHSVKPRIPHLLALVALTGLTAAGAAAGPSQTTTRTYFVLGQRLVAVPAHRTTVRGAVTQLLAGPSARDAKRGLRTFVPRATRLRAASLAGDTATVDLGAPFAVGTREARTARIAQLVYTASSVPGVRSVLLRVGGRTPSPRLFPGLDLTRPIDRADITRPKEKPPRYRQPKRGPPSPATRKLQQRLAYLGFLPAADIDGKTGPETTLATIGFQKWAGLGRDGVPGPATMDALATAKRPTPILAGTGRRVEVLLDRQLTLLIDGNRVVATIPASTGKGVNATPPGSFRVFRKEVMSWSYPFQVWLPWASYFYGGIAFHEYADVPTQAASHGCVRTPRYWSQQLYHFTPIGTPVRVVSRSV